MSSQWYQPNLQLEIYNFRVVQGLQMSNEIDFLKIYMRICLKIKKLHCFATNEVPFRFQEELMVRFEPQKRDLQF